MRSKRLCTTPYRLYRPHYTVPHLRCPLLRCIQLCLQDSQLFLSGRQPPLQLRQTDLGGLRSCLQL